MYYQNKREYLPVIYIIFETIYYIFETMCILFNNDNKYNKILSINYFCRWSSEST